MGKEGLLAERRDQVFLLARTAFPTQVRGYHPMVARIACAMDIYAGLDDLRRQGRLAEGLGPCEQ